MRPEEFARRRRKLMRHIGDGAIAIVPNAPVSRRSRDVEYPYRADSDFYYLTGFSEPRSVAVIAPGNGHAEFVMFCAERDAERERWDGPKQGPEEAVELYGADDAFPIDDIEEILPGMIEKRERVYYTMGIDTELDHQIIGWIKKLRSQGHAAEEFIALDHVVHDLRLYKSRAEIAVMRKSARIASDAHCRAMRVCQPGMMEFEVAAEISHEFYRKNVVPSYPAIVGGGDRACVLHYIKNDQKLEDGELLLIDAGCEYQYYASDITRTFPVNGKFSDAQKDIYEIVLAAQLAAIEKTQVGNSWDDPHMVAVQVITKGLAKLGILSGQTRNLIKTNAFRRFYMHRTGHWIGLDVHDVGDYKVDNEWRLLEAGMVLTVEPGIYIPLGARGVPKKYQGIGIRIEDDVLVAKNGPEVLSKYVPKDIEGIEALCA